MQWTDDAIILSVKKFSERDAVVAVLSRTHGLWRAMARGAYGRTHRGTYQPGNRVQARWNARLAEHMGTLACEVNTPVAALVMDDPLALAGVSALCALLERSMAERDPHPGLYDAAAWVLCSDDSIIDHRSSVIGFPSWLPAYVRFELALLKETGFGLDLRRCAATGESDNLMYVSPKSGRAVCAEAGAPYREKLLPLPGFLRESALTPQPAELLDGLRVTGYFLERWLFAAKERKVPAARYRLLEMLQEKYGSSRDYRPVGQATECV